MAPVVERWTNKVLVIRRYLFECLENYADVIESFPLYTS